MLIQVDEPGRAIEVIEDIEDPDTRHEYDYALAQLLAGDAVKAATALRRGLLMNPYIGEAIVHRKVCDLVRAALAEEADIDRTGRIAEAEGYLTDSGALWRRSPFGRAFVRWVTTHPGTQREANAARGCEWTMGSCETKEERYIEAEERLDSLIEAVDEETSKTIAATFTSAAGTRVRPWELL